MDRQQPNLLIDETSPRDWIVRGIVAIVLGIALWLGLPIEGGLRHWVFQQTMPIRFLPDIDRGFHWGRTSYEMGYLSVYDYALPRQSREQWLDYAPLRLATMTIWATINQHRFPGVTEYQNTFEFTAPVLWTNTAIELLGAIGIGMLTRHWIRRKQPFGTPISPNCGLIGGAIAGLLLWFNPAAIMSAHGWPTWDIWIVTFYIWAIYLVCLDAWFWAGAILAVGAMLKGQQLAVACLFIVWPLSLGAPRIILRLMLIAIAALVLRLFFTKHYVGDFAGIVFALAAIGSIGLMLATGRWIYVLKLGSGFILFTGIIVSGWMLRTQTGSLNWLALAWVLLPIAAAIAIFILLPRFRQFSFVHGYAIGSALLLCITMFDASTAWYECGWRFGTTHFYQLMVGLPNNLPALLTRRFGIENGITGVDSIVFTIPASLQLGLPGTAINITLRTLMQGIFLLMLLPCAVAAADHARRNDVRFLVAITAPWLLFYTIPLQIHERYLLYAAGVSACMVAVSSGMTLLHIVLSIFSWAVTSNIMLNPARRREFEAMYPNSLFIQYGDTLRYYCNSLHPDSAWAIILITLMFFYFAITPTPRAPGDAIIAHHANENPWKNRLSSLRTRLRLRTDRVPEIGTAGSSGDDRALAGSGN